MIVVIQRDSSASVTIDKTVKATIQKGLLVLVGIEEADSKEDILWLASKLVNLRIFNDTDGVMNVSVKDDGGDIIIVSQFTLHGSTRKG
jgi:D-tyrosyl-tRNA(Tyr) deacylase